MDRVHWVADESVTHCLKCGVRFDMLTRKHHCRMCGNVFCDACSSFAIDVPVLEIRGARGCQNCHSFMTLRLPVLLRETTFTRCDVDVDPYEVKLRVSRDQDEITWKSARHNFNIVEKLSLADFQRVSMGQIGPGFDNAKPFALLACCLGPGITEHEASSFALVFRQESLDLIAQSPTSMREWVDAFQELVARFESAATTTIRETKASEAAHQKQEAREELRGRYRGKAEVFKTKYGAINK